MHGWQCRVLTVPCDKAGQVPVLPLCHSPVAPGCRPAAGRGRRVEARADVQGAPRPPGDSAAGGALQEVRDGGGFARRVRVRACGLVAVWRGARRACVHVAERWCGGGRGVCVCFWPGGGVSGPARRRGGEGGPAPAGAPAVLRCQLAGQPPAAPLTRQPHPLAGWLAVTPVTVVKVDCRPGAVTQLRGHTTLHCRTCAARAA